MDISIKRIQAYFQNELTDEEVEAYENDLKINPELAQRTAKYRQMLQSIGRHAYEMAKAKEIQEEYEMTLPPKNKWYKTWRILLPILFLLLATATITYYLTLPAPKAPRAGKEREKKNPTDSIQKPTADTTKKQKPLPAQPEKQEQKPTLPAQLDTTKQKPLPAPIQTEAEKERIAPQNINMENQMKECAAEGNSKGSNIKGKEPKNYQKLKGKATFKWVNDNRKGSYTITIFDRYGDPYNEKIFKDIKPQNNEGSFEVSLTDFEPAFYFWELRYAGEQPFIGGFIVEK